MENNYQVVNTDYDHDMDWFSVEGFMNPNKYMPDVFIRGGQRTVKKLLMVVRDERSGKAYLEMGYWYPEKFHTVEFEDYDDYDPKNFPHLEDDPEKSVIWVKEGFYSIHDCDRCETRDYQPVNVVAWKYLPEIPQFFKDGI